MYADLEYSYVFQVVTKQVSHLSGCFCAFEILVALATKTDLGAVVYTGSLGSLVSPTVKYYRENI